MDQGWAAVIGAAAAGTFGIAGSLAGITVGRRQTTDQASVEHQQWMRDQRQTAYVNLLNTWDQAVGELESVVDDWDDIDRDMTERGVTDEFPNVIRGRLSAAWGVTSAALERVSLLGPAAVDAAVGRMDAVFDDVRAWLGDQALPVSGVWDDGRWSTCRSELHRARSEFLVAARAAVRNAPRPGR
ncbi:hypothetical protein KVH31_34815 [Streptomyces olivaceus]|uniref:hypothetical protein n=1 Tax=Streptomyces olivaceus TaxID=47716 RepID=UPI0006B59586|nr:hypothetical protein [Streptomyces olivaceus]KPC69086.1 hypothetical protein ADL27_54995 [Streptomyces sp. NRRL F-6602]MBZ6211671.1 hypothetical protein [Streptomyces olivaceus]